MPALGREKRPQCQPGDHVVGPLLAFSRMRKPSSSVTSSPPYDRRLPVRDLIGFLLRLRNEPANEWRFLNREWRLLIEVKTHVAVAPYGNTMPGRLANREPGRPPPSREFLIPNHAGSGLGRARSALRVVGVFDAPNPFPRRLVVTDETLRRQRFCVGSEGRSDRQQADKYQTTAHKESSASAASSSLQSIGRPGLATDRIRRWRPAAPCGVMQTQPQLPCSSPDAMGSVAPCQWTFGSAVQWWRR